MIELFDRVTGQPLGAITEEQFQFLQDHLEEESLSDQDYYLNQATLDAFAQEGADPALLALLRQALGDNEEMEIVWRCG
jgi:processive 1,2-diacylglycerol beta-glucosyltransferase